MLIYHNIKNRKYLLLLLPTPYSLLPTPYSLFPLLYMSSPSQSETLTIAYFFGALIAITVMVYLLRGFGIITFIPGGILWLLILLSIGTGLVYGVQKTRRY